jgi:uncharacterized protein YndB with AHSA1/START domain
MEATASRTISASPARVAKIMFDPVHDPEWIGGARQVDAPHGDPTRLGAQVIRHGGFLGRRFSWMTEVSEYRPDRLLRMDFVAGPMKGGEVAYRIEPSEAGSIVSIRNRGPGPQIMAWFVKRSVGKDLDRLAAIVERT